MIDVKRIVTADKMLYINIKYLNYIILKDKNNNNINIPHEVCNNANICFFGIKNKNKYTNKKIRQNASDKELTAIQEENKVDLIDLSDSN